MTTIGLRADPLESGSNQTGAVTSATPTQPNRLLARARRSVWLPVALKLSAIGLGMLGLAGVGTASILLGQQGVRVEPPAPVAASIGGAWIAAVPEAEPEAHASPEAHAPAHAPGEASAEPECGHGEKLCAEGDQKDKPRGITPDGKVILNVASAEELTRLPGVGQSRAEAIVALRTRLKRFRRTSDLLRVRGIGVRSLKRMLPHLVLDPPKLDDAGAENG
jgi:competence protein ComEA